MNILELDSYNLADAVKFNKELNPRIWQNNKMRPEVRAKLLEIAEDFKQFLGLTDLEIKDITISGSNASYTYTPHSDIDLHLIADIPRADQDDVYRELFDAKKYQYNDLHDIQIGGHDVELYVENANKPAVSQGNYSLVRDDWNSIPKQRRSTVDDDAVRSKYEDLKHRIDAAIQSQDVDVIDNLARKIKLMRQAGLDQHGELGSENLAYKILRTQGYIRRLYDARADARDAELSLPEQQAPVTYGFRSQVDEVGLTPDGVNPTTCMIVDEKETMTDQDMVEDFIKYCAQELGLRSVPNIKLRHDPEWSVRHMTFGRYTDELNRLEVATANRHIMDILRTVAHELVHRHQHETQDVPADAGRTGSEQENEANARAGILMRGYAEQHPEYFEHGALEESASGYIPTKKQAHDPRYEMALTQDIRPGQVGQEANKLKLKTNRQGQPQIARADGLVESLAAELCAFQSGQITEMDRLGNQRVTGPEFPPTMPAGTVRVDVSDVYDWYKLGQHISNMKGLGHHDFGQGPPSTIVSFGSEDEEHKYIDDLEKLGLTVTDVDPVQPGDEKRKKVKRDPTYNVDQIAESQILDEVAMTPGALRDWAASPEAQGIQAGFEAELIFRDTQGDSDYNEPDYSYDPYCRSIDDILEFFEDGEHNSRYEVMRLRDQLRSDYQEYLDDMSHDSWLAVQDRRVADWVKDNYNPFDDARNEVEDQNPDLDPDSEEFRDLVEQTSEKMLDQMIEVALEDPANEYHEEALDDWREDYFSEDHEDEWLESAGISTMSDVLNTYNITWPIYESGGGSREPDEIGKSLQDATGMDVIVSGGYHTTKRQPNTWTIEPDGSLEPSSSDSAGLEVVSPPMPLDQALTQLANIQQWALDPDQGNAYTNKSTGLHMGVSLPSQDTSQIDYVKLILFMGDQYVLEKFERQANTYCRSSLSKLQEKITTGNLDPKTFLQQMRQGVENIASEDLRSGVGTNKYTSAHIKGSYIEFRSPGNDWLQQDLNTLTSTMLRFARAMQIAGDPLAYQQEYAKKLYKLLAPRDEKDPIALFAQYVAGDLPKAALKRFVKNIQLQRQATKPGQPEPSVSGRQTQDYIVSWTDQSGQLNQQRITARNSMMALDDVRNTLQHRGISASNISADPAPLAGSTQDLALQRSQATQHVTNPLWQEPQAQAAAQPQGQFTGRWLIRNTNTGQVVHTMSGIGNVQDDANRHALRWLRDNGDPGMHFEVVPEMNESMAEDAVQDLEQDLRKPRSYKAIDHVMRGVSQVNRTTPKKLHDRFVDKHGEIPDEWIKKLDEALAALDEGATSVLYHYTSVNAALNILQQGAFQLSSSMGTSVEQQYAPEGYNYFLSTSRVKSGDYARYVGSSGVMFVLDGNWLNQRYPVKPMDYWERAWLQSDGTRTRESEDRVFSREPEINIAPVKAMHVLIKEQHEYRSPQIRRLMILAKRQNIPAYLYTDESAWRLQDRRRAVTPKQAGELLRGQEPKRTTWPARTYLDRWLELIHKKNKSELSPEADKLRYNLQYYSADGDHQLGVDLGNARKPDAGDRYQAVKIIDYMRRNRLRTPADLVDAMRDKWKTAS